MGIELPEQAENAQPELPAELLKRLPAFESELQDPKTQQQAIDSICHALVEPWFEHDEALLLELLEPVGEVEKEEPEEDCLGEAVALNVHCRWYVEVLFPCLIEYQERPDVLFEQAKNGDYQALEKLVRLDKWAASLPEWLGELYSVDQARAAKMRQTMAKALDKPPAGKIDLTSVKIEIGGLVGRTFQAAGLDINVRKVRELFDAVACIDHGAERDIHLPVDDANFSKHLQRSKRRWRAYIPDMPPELQNAMKAYQRQRNAASKPKRRKAA